jgi:hypothetical protein
MKKLFLIILSIALSITGCEISDFGDTNKNVNGPLEGNTASLLSGAMTNFGARQGRPYRINPTLNVQYFMQLVYNDEMLYPDFAAAPGGELQVIGEEKWVALYPLGYDAWAEWRRTEFPSLLPAPDAINSGEIPRRYNYPNDEVTLNSTNYNSGVSSLSPATNNNTSRVWWNQ